MPLHQIAVLAGCILFLCAPRPARAQAAAAEPRFSLSISGAFADLFVFESHSFGKTFNVGVGAGSRVTNRLWAEAEVHRFFGLVADPARCGLVASECTGGGREGYDAAIAGSIGATYRLGSGSVRASLTGGWGFIRASGYRTTTFSGGRQVERERDSYGWGPTLGAGLHIPFGSRWAIEPTLRLYAATGPNLSVFRAAVALTRAF